jgi:hypothetical protein
VQTHRLVCHPDFAPPDGVSIEVQIERSGGALNLIYWLLGPDEAVKMPVGQPRFQRIDGLWKQTCFEAFIIVRDRSGYSELNFSPSGAWAAYSFKDYRAGMNDLIGANEPLIEPGYRGSRESDDAYGWSYSTTNFLDELANWQVGLSAIIEAADGTKSYWALRHPPGKPDFHHADCFALTLPPPKRS